MTEDHRSSKKSAKKGGRKPHSISRSPWFGECAETAKSPSVVKATTSERSMASGAMLETRAYTGSPASKPFANEAELLTGTAGGLRMGLPIRPSAPRSLDRGGPSRPPLSSLPVISHGNSTDADKIRSAFAYVNRKDVYRVELS